MPSAAPDVTPAWGRRRTHPTGGRARPGSRCGKARQPGQHVSHGPVRQGRTHGQRQHAMPEGHLADNVRSKIRAPVALAVAGTHASARGCGRPRRWASRAGRDASYVTGRWSVVVSWRLGEQEQLEPLEQLGVSRWRRRRRQRRPKGRHVSCNLRAVSATAGPGDTIS